MDIFQNIHPAKETVANYYIYINVILLVGNYHHLLGFMPNWLMYPVMRSHELFPFSTDAVLALAGCILETSANIIP